MNTTHLSSTELAARRNEQARRRNGIPATTATEARTLATRDGMPDLWGHGKRANETHTHDDNDGRCNACDTFLSVYNPTSRCATCTTAHGAGTVIDDALL
jgi:hypothetical protein